MVAVAIMGVVTAGMLTLQNNSAKLQKQNQIIQVAQDLETRIRSLITDQQSWNAIMSANSNMACLNPPTPCTVGTYTFDLWDNGGNVFYQSLWSDTADGNGFTEGGVYCPGAYTNAGNPLCPIAYYLTWQPICPAGSSCINPPIRIDATMHYQTGLGTTTINTLKYSIVNFIRSANHVDKSFSIVHQVNGSGGACTGPSVARPLSIDKDPFLLVTGLPTLPAAGATVFTLRTPGTYKCTGNAVGFGVNGFKIELQLSPGGVVLGGASGFAPSPNGQASATFQTIFTVTTPQSYSLVQTCLSSIGPTDLGFNSMGGVTTYASLVCTLID